MAIACRDRFMSQGAKTLVPGIALFYQHHYFPDAETIQEHLNSFSRYSRFPIYPVNLVFGLPPGLKNYHFAGYVFHYTLAPAMTWLTPDVEEYLDACTPSHRVAIFQDEVYYFQERYSFLNRCKIDCLYSRHKPCHVRDLYAAHAPVKDFVYYLAGYVDDDLIARGQAHHVPFDQRPVDVGYRSRPLPFYMGRGAQEKTEIGRRFQQLAGGSLQLDISSE